MPDALDALVERSRHIADAWAAGHSTAAEKVGPELSPVYFTGARGNLLIAALEALPVGSAYEAYEALVAEHTAKPLDD